MNPSYQLSELCALVDLPIRTVRYYVQQGLVDRPAGETRAARYGTIQLEQLKQIKKWTTTGLSLERIRELLKGEDPHVPERGRRRGTLEVVSRLTVADGVELVIEPSRAGLTPQQVRSFSQEVMRLFDELTWQPETLRRNPGP